MFKNVIKEQLKVPAHIDYLADLRDFVTRVGRKHGVSEKSINAFKLAIDEAGTNIIRHAYREFDEPGFILLRVIVRKASVTVSLIDQGKYFDPKGVKDPDLKRYVDIGKKGGLGIFIIRKLMDDIDYRRTEEGNELRLTKFREENRKNGAKAISERVKGIPLSLKAKYFIRTAVITTFLIVTVYSFFYIRIGKVVKEDYLAHLAEISNNALAELTTHPRNFQLENLHHLFASVLDLYKKYQEDVYELHVIGNQGLVEVTSDTSKIISEKEKLIGEKVRVAQNVFQYTIEDDSNVGQPKILRLYDYVAPIVLPDKQEPWGELHVRILKSQIDQEILRRRWEYGRVALSILLMSYAGVLLLIYLLLNPFRKLADWVRALDHGEVQDEMDIDSSTEIGEIAKAFSEITTKFRESQKHLAEQEQLQKEMQVAQEIQQTLLPTEFPDIEGYEISSYYEAAKEVGGDYFDFVEVDKDTMGIVVADVSGKGVPGSLVMTMIRTALRTEARGVKDAAEVLARVNDFVVGDMKKGMFVTIFYVIIDSKRRRLNYASAGHNPMVLYRPITRKTYYLNPKGFPIGIQLAEEDLFRRSIESDTIQLAEDDILLLYTDGITEAMNKRRNLFGEERLLKVIREYGHLRVKPFIERVQLEISSFTEGNIQYDDITLVAIKEKTSPEKEELRRAKLAHKMIAENKSIREACETAGITTYAYYNKYKRQFEQEGVDNFELDEVISVEAKHISIEDKTKIFDIIKFHPEYGAKRISEELNTEKYGFTIISENKVYDELVRSRLNTRQLREAFVARGGRSKRQLKPPGTPMLTLDGRIILDQKILEDSGSPKIIESTLPPKEEERPDRIQPPPIEIKRRAGSEEEVNVDMETISTPLEDLLDKSKNEKAGALEQEEAEISQDQPESPDDIGDTEKIKPPALEDEKAIPGEETVSFQELFTGGSILEEPTAEVDAQNPESDPEKTGAFYASPAANIRQTGAKKNEDAESPAKEATEPLHPIDDDFAMGAIEDLLKEEIISSFEELASHIFIEGLEEKNESVDTSEAHPEHRGYEWENDNLEMEAAEPEQTTTPVDNRSEKSETPEDELELFQSLELGFSENRPTGLEASEPPSVDGNGTTAAACDEPEQPPSGEDQADQADVKKDDTDIFIKIFSEPPRHISVEPKSQEIWRKKPLPPDRTRESRPTQSERKEKLDRAIRSKQSLRHATPSKDEKEKLLILGLRFYKIQNFDKAIAMFQRAIDHYPGFKEAYSILGNAFFRKGSYREAFKAYLKVLELDPRDATALENIGVIFANQGNLEKAIKQWQKILRIDPNRQDIQKKIEKGMELLREKEYTE